MEEATRDNQVGVEVGLQVGVLVQEVEVGVEV